MNRGVARRTLFAGPADYRFFKAQLAHAVRRGEIEVHAFCLMGTHYHLLIRVPGAGLSRAMMRIQNAYSRYFNRSQRRDGTLVRGRFVSKPVRSMAYRTTLVRYIDMNPCKARLVRHAAEYANGSAAHYATRKGPIWLTRTWVEAKVKETYGRETYEPADYARRFSGLSSDAWDLVEARLAASSSEDPLDELLDANRVQVRRWMERKARLADGTRPILPVSSLHKLEATLAQCRAQPWPLKRGRGERDGWNVLYVGLARQFCGTSLQSLGVRLNVSHQAVSSIARIHHHELRAGGEYTERAAGVLHAVLHTEPGEFCNS